MNQDILQSIRAKMRAAAVPDATIDTFLGSVKKVAAGERGQIPESTITSVEELPALESLPAAGGKAAELLNQLAVIKLNGGLGTSMGL